MAAFIDENTQFEDRNGNLLVNGRLYIGSKGNVAKGNEIPIFSDRALTAQIANPQILNAEGRSPIKIWVTGEYSLFVEDTNVVQHLREDDQGELAGVNNVALTITGGTNNAIDAAASPTITAYVDKTFYILQAPGANTGNMTLNVDNIGAKFIRQNVDQEIQPGKVQLNQTMVLSFNSTTDQFDWINHSDKILDYTKAADIIANTTTNIWGSLGNYVFITGVVSPVGPITSFGIAPQGGSFREIKIDAINTIEHDITKIICPGKVDIITAVDDTFEVIADDANIARIVNYQRFQPVSQDGWTLVGPIDLTDLDFPPLVELLTSLSNVNEIEIYINGLIIDRNPASGNTRVPLIQLGNSTAYKTAAGDYTGMIYTFDGSNGARDNLFVEFGFLLMDTGQGSDNRIVESEIKLRRINAENLWSYTTSGALLNTVSDTAPRSNFGMGTVDLGTGVANQLTRVQITIDPGGTANVWNAGTARVKFR